MFLMFSAITMIAVAQNNNPNYDSVLAKSLGADEYGMKKYVLVILKTGSNTTADKATKDSLFAGHMANIGRLADIGKLVVAGPLGKNDKNYRGIFIFNVSTVAEADELVQTDPAVKAEIFDVELYPWYGSAALPEYLKAEDKIWKIRH
jgi:uncharacterized protein YciI